MSIAIRRYPKQLQDSVASRRIRGKTMGLGYWAAIDHQIRGRKKHENMENAEQKSYEQKPETSTASSS